MIETDILIIGAGPVGLFAVFECGMLKMRTHVVDALDMVGGQCAALYPEKPIYDIPAHPSLTGEELIKNLQDQIAPFHPTFHLGQQVEHLTHLPNGGFEVTTSKGTQFRVKAIIIAAGAGAFGPKRPPLANLEDYEGSGVFYYVTQKERFRGKRLVIAGGGDSAVDWAIALSDIAASVQVVHRRAQFRASPETTARLHELANAGRIELVVPYQLASLEGDAGTLTGVGVETLDGDGRLLAADALLAFFGLSSNLGPLTQWGVEGPKGTFAIDPATGETNVPGIFACGDVASYPHKLKLILTGFAEAAQSAHKAYAYVFPGKALHFEHSTTSGVPSAGSEVILNVA
ncbi:MAG: ferredoxin--NADP(+) reductase [Candidatus Puniceispirillum sp.]|nr:ferredoxin--NADP(+) reductase [Candidatus Puniceispirillum sp.]